MSIPSLSEENYYLEELDEDFEVETETSYNPRQGKSEYIGFVDGLEALVQYINYQFGVERYLYSNIFDDSFGLQTADLIGEERDYIEGELDLRIREMLLCDERILDISDISYTETEKGSLIAKFTIYTIWGSKVIEQEVSNIV